MDVFIYLFPFTILISLIGIIFLLWSIKSGQFDDMDGASQRMLNNSDRSINDNEINNCKRSEDLK